MCGFVPLGVARTTSYPASTRAVAGTTVSLRYWPVAPVPPPCTSILVALEQTTSTVFFDIIPPALLYPMITIAPQLRPAARWAGRRTIQHWRRLAGAVGLKGST